MNPLKCQLGIWKSSKHYLKGQPIKDPPTLSAYIQGQEDLFLSEIFLSLRAPLRT